MAIEVFFAVLLAAALHAGWNSLVKINAEPIIAMGLIMVCISIVALAFIPFVAFPPDQMWPWLLVTLVLHFGYKVFLVKAYAQGDFGQVYPIARGSGPLWVLLASLVFLGAEFTQVQVIGILLITGGVAILSHFKRGKPLSAGFYYALVTGLWIASYTIVDGYVVSQIGHLHSFVVWMFFLDGIVAIIWAYRYNPKVFVASLTQHWFVAVGGGAMSMASYWICLWAMTQVPIAIVAALRETSVLFGALLSTYMFKETLGRSRWISVAFICSGLVLIKLV
ncbi:MAG: drug/metabolite transporter (DMT)-like permease [Oceanospirillaceae bacterium]|jgi:drug/metabolite transporter (DMT)-like permease|tara:strand:- start:1746 stop:2582 length:837 start_codon:yes stop_codon:yes gene_type:complete